MGTITLSDIRAEVRASCEKHGLGFPERIEASDPRVAWRAASCLAYELQSCGEHEVAGRINLLIEQELSPKISAEDLADLEDGQQIDAAEAEYDGRIA